MKIITLLFFPIKSPPLSWLHHPITSADSVSSASPLMMLTRTWSCLALLGSHLQCCVLCYRKYFLTLEIFFCFLTCRRRCRWPPCPRVSGCSSRTPAAPNMLSMDRCVLSTHIFILWGLNYAF